MCAADFSDWQGVGQNVARDIAPGEKGKFNATKLVGHWFRQIRFFDPKGVEEFGWVLPYLWLVCKTIFLDPETNVVLVLATTLNWSGKILLMSVVGGVSSSTEDSRLVGL